MTIPNIFVKKDWVAAGNKTESSSEMTAISSSRLDGAIERKRSSAEKSSTFKNASAITVSTIQKAFKVDADSKRADKLEESLIEVRRPLTFSSRLDLDGRLQLEPICSWIILVI